MSLLRFLSAGLVLGFAGAAAAQTVPLKATPDHSVRSTPDTVVWGYFAADIPPVARIKSGQTVRIDTVSHGGINLPDDSNSSARPASRANRFCRTRSTFAPR